jgi:hypothetical protein
MNIDFDKYLNVLRQVNATIEEIRLLEMLKNESDWKSLSGTEKQKKRKSAISYIERVSEDNIDLSFEKNIVEIYDLGNSILDSASELTSSVFVRLKVFVKIEQEFIDEYPVNKLAKIRTVDFAFFSKLLEEVARQDINQFNLLKLDTYKTLLEKIWYRDVNK